MINSKKQMFIVIGVFAVLLMLTTVTYAFFNYTRTGVANRISVGRIYFNSEQGNAINLTNVFPIDRSEVSSENDNVGSVTIHITGDTTYSQGIEYLVTAVDVNNTIGEGNNTKTIPISVLVDYEETENKTIGTEDTDYFDNRGGNTSLYKILSKRPIGNDSKLVVGYIKPDATGIDGTITINAYLDKGKIGISDTHSSENNNQDVYMLNPNPSESDIANCVEYFSSMNVTLLSGESYDAFCRGTGTISNMTLSQLVSMDYFIEDLLSINMIIQENSSDIYGTTSSWVNGRTVLTTTEWNSLQNSSMSFKIKVEANEGIWVPKQDNAMGIIPPEVIPYEVLHNIKEIYFDSMNSNEMHQRYKNATYKIDLTYNNEGEVLTWLEENTTDSSKYTMYIASDGITYLTTGEYLFSSIGITEAEIIEFNNVNTSRVTTMNHMFYDQSNLVELDLRSFDTSNVVNMPYFISNCPKIETINMDGLDLKKVDKMQFMFAYDPLLSEIKLNGVETRDVTSMGSMFYGDSSLESVDLSNFGGNNLSYINSIFSTYNSSLKSINMENFNFGVLTNVMALFMDLSSLETVDLSNVDMSNITNINSLFKGDIKLETIYVSTDWTVGDVTNSTDMFLGCESLVGGNNTPYDENNPMDKTMAVIDNNDHEGYLTLKTN